MSSTTINYREYLQTATWRSKRNRRLQLADWRCEQCGTRRDLQVHHITYERLGREWDQDLEVLCRECHRALHVARFESKPTQRLYLRIARLAEREVDELTIGAVSEITKQLCARYKIPYDGPTVHRAIALLSHEWPADVPRVDPFVASPEPAPSRPLSAREAVEWFDAHPEFADRTTVIRTMRGTHVARDPEELLAADRARRQRGFHMGIELDIPIPPPGEEISPRPRRAIDDVIRELQESIAAETRDRE